jgi:uridine kinase/SAM-dependent methyltransferase
METSPSKAIRYDLLVVLIGVACALAAERFVDKYSSARLISTAAFFITSLNFLHGKTVALDDESYNRALIHRPGFALLDFVLNVAVVLTFVFMALYLDDPTRLLRSNIIVRAIDVLIILGVKHVSDQPVLNRAQNTWLGIDAFALVVFGSALAFWQFPSTGAIPALFLAVVLLDICIDYRVNRRMYFSTAQSWGEMVDIWDAAQGRGGDIYRRHVVIPALSAACNFAGKSVLDLGCGNGCVSRFAEDAGAKQVVAVDKYESMIEAAGQYLRSKVRYIERDMDTCDEILKPDGFDIVIACFSLQDCEEIEKPLRMIWSNLAQGGRAFIVFENDAAFESEAGHVTTGRRPLDRRSHAGRGRRWLIFWGSPFAMLSQSDTWQKQTDAMAALAMVNTARTVITITRHWSIFEYLRAAKLAGLQPAAAPSEIPSAGSLDNPVLRKYTARPKFSMLSLERREDRIRPRFAHSLPLILIAGSSGTGKTHLTRHLQRAWENVVVVNLDDFSFDKKDKRLAPSREKPDWESPDNVDMGAAAAAIDKLLQHQDAEIPIYDMKQSEIAGHRIVSGASADLVVVEGLFAFHVFAPKTDDVTRILLSGSGPRLLFRRVGREFTAGRRGRLHCIPHSIKLWWNDSRYEKANSPMTDKIYPYDMDCQELAERIRAEAHLQTQSDMDRIPS